MSRCAAAARLPAVHPLAAICVLVLDPYWLRSLDQIFLRSKKIIVCGEHTAANAFRGKVEQIGELAHASPRRSTRPRRPAGKSPEA